MANQEAARPGSERFEELFQAGRSAFASEKSSGTLASQADRAARVVRS